MKERLKITLLIFFFVCCLYGAFSCGIANTGEAVHKSYTIEIGSDTIYVKASSWGLTGDHIQIVFSPHPYGGKYFDSSLCFTYFEPTIYYKKNSDTLELYPTIKTDIPAGFNKSIYIKQNVINQSDDINRFKERYREYGLEKISVYE